LPTKQVCKVAPKTGENSKLFEKCIIDNIPQLGLLASSLLVIFKWTTGCVQLSCLPFMLVYWTISLVYNTFN